MTKHAPSDDTWVTRDKRVVKVREMETKHLIYAMQYLERRALQTKINLRLQDVDPKNIVTEMFPIYAKMRDELESRLAGKQPDAGGRKSRRIELE